MMWHLSDMQTLVSSAQVATLRMSPLFIMLTSAFMHWLGVTLSSVIWVWCGFVVVALACLLWLLPTLSEYRAEAGRVLGTALPSKDQHTAWKVVKGILSMLRKPWSLHLLTILTLAAVTTMGSVYEGLLGEWCTMLFGSSAAGERLATIVTALGIIAGVCLSPLLAYVSDNLRYGTTLVHMIAIISVCSSSVTIGLTTWFAQIATAMFTSVSSTVFQILLLRYYTAFAGPDLLGTFSGVTMAVSS
eukprot:CAMPEP_0115302524 /NCGR_PEP_ID=MMETSP0270-20121206/70428_1 /TAXON_ID=71861 /ORGANISM="Scrippsiella trochoidea, Strain CCMP3099" /LENGTH=244 /DNA_ID=CAMNT_0002720455 /DNA_START=195 /DNA_END=925 /DNA_ORIENTATION=+